MQELAKAHNSVRECAKAVCKCVKSVTRRIMAPPFATPPTPHASLTPLPSFKWSPPPPLKAENKRRMVTTATIKIIFKGPKMGGKAFLIIVADAADAVSVNFSGRCKFLQI